jgi:hypothetical protein
VTRMRLKTAFLRKMATDQRHSRRCQCPQLYVHPVLSQSSPGEMRLGLV